MQWPLKTTLTNRKNNPNQGNNQIKESWNDRAGKDLGGVLVQSPTQSNNFFHPQEMVMETFSNGAFTSPGGKLFQ